jgi:4'-phosphopantetheinyl transferase EntD
VSVFTGLLDRRLAVAEMNIGDLPIPLLPEEEAFVARAVSRRRNEFAAGRACARQALAAIGETPGALLPGSDRLPIWPPGVRGSITHTDRLCAAAVGRRDDGLQSVGIDLEPAEPLPADLWDTVCVPAERHWLDGTAPGDRGLLARALFSAKECAFKCQYPLTSTMLEFHDLVVTLDRNMGTFSARLGREAPPFRRGHTLAGRIRIANPFIACAMVIDA